MRPRVTLIQGGGAGEDMAPAVQKILASAGADIDWDVHYAGGEAIKRGTAPIGPALFESLRKNRVALKTKLLPDPKKPTVNYNVALRKDLGLFASVRPLRNIPGLPARFTGVDMLVIRELTEDLYAAIEHVISPDIVQSIKVVTEKASKRFFEFAFEWARAKGRKTVTCVHKANILKLADGLFLEAFRETAKKYPDITPKDLIVDNCCMQIVAKPTQFDVLAMGNLYGDIVSDLGAGVVGGINAAHGINVGDGLTVFDCFHGGTREEIGANAATPLPLLLPAIDLLDELKMTEPSERIQKAVEGVLKEGKVKTRDMGGRATTSEFADAVIGKLS